MGERQRETTVNGATVTLYRLTPIGFALSVRYRTQCGPHSRAFYAGRRPATAEAARGHMLACILEYGPHLGIAIWMTDIYFHEGWVHARLPEPRPAASSVLAGQDIIGSIEQTRHAH